MTLHRQSLLAQYLHPDYTKSALTDIAGMHGSWECECCDCTAIRPHARQCLEQAPFSNWQFHCTQASKAQDVLDKRWRQREKQCVQETGAKSLPPAWFELREPDGLLGPQGKFPRYRYHPDNLNSTARAFKRDIARIGRACDHVRRWEVLKCGLLPGEIQLNPH